MSNYYLCETCAVKHVGGEMQSFIPFFSCSAKPTSMAGMIPIADGEIPREVCPYYKPKVMHDEVWNTRAERTCNLIEDGDSLHCSNCGGAAEKQSWAYWNYCPNCRARVIGR